MRKLITKRAGILVMSLLVIAYIIYFSILGVFRYKTLYASYFDLGIMHQTVYNTYRSIQTGDASRFLELTNPYGPDQMKRMAIHNDILLAFIAPLYFIHSGPATLIVLQTIVLGLGGFVVFALARYEFRDKKYGVLLAVVFGLSYLLFSPLERANLFDFHAVTLSTTFLLAMFYFWFRKRLKLTILFFILSIFSKEQVALTTFVFGLYTLYSAYKKEKGHGLTKYRFGIFITLTSFLWFILSFSFIIPHFRGSQHFALKYFNEFGDSTGSVLLGFFKNPGEFLERLFRPSTYRYMWFLLGPTGFLAVLSPALFIAAPEFAINILSSSRNMQNIIYHYTAVLVPFIFIATIFASKKIMDLGQKKYKKNVELPLVVFILFFSFMFSYFKSPLPYSKEKEIHPFKYPQKESKAVMLWADALKNENLKVSSTGHLAPFFTARRYFYTFSDRYPLADYIIVRPNEILTYPEKKELTPEYHKLQQDKRFELIFIEPNLEVYKKI